MSEPGPETSPPAPTSGEGGGKRAGEVGGGILHLQIPIDTAEDLRALRGALLAARASELSEVQRRAGRLNLGYGTDSTRDSMSDEVANLRRRWAMLDRLIDAVDEADRQP